METGYFVAAEVSSAPALNALIGSIGDKAIHFCAWVLPWAGFSDSLGENLRDSLPTGTHLVISEATGGWTIL